MPRSDELKATFRKMIAEGQFSHAVLIEGEKGIERDGLAFWTAKALLCESGDPPCCDCSICRKVDSRNHPDVNVVLPEEKKKTIGIDPIRDVKETLYYAPSEGKRKIYIIPDAETMTAEAENALLKSLEEPPENVCFILLTENKRLLLDTIVSRTLCFQLSTMTVEECIAALTEKYPEKDPAEIRTAAMAYGGSYSAASDEMKGGLGGMTVLARDTVSLLKSGRGYELLRRLDQLAKDRDDLGSYFEKLGNILGYSVTMKLRGKASDIVINPADAEKIREILERGKLAVSQNASKGLLAGWFVSSAAEVFGGNV